ncbi:hypothetical protein [Hoeflea prorocentri]|uniref:Lipoprotein n=1 Tax=Hoeflea prorocentri TaxID=1922333 RepID=A0A9X3UEX0_9HYPH|nr:hypothetical protein [Hoeflea prorocentri]MCY6379600.1 hypothetical protein [Hoeflea prorocentri]MDA5397400.1 hypothetical protein [Hoeflea prorocentri]
MRTLFVVLLAFGLAACGHVPLSSIPKLKRMDFMTMEVEVLRVAVEMPDGLRVRPGSAIINLGLNESAGEPALQERIVLQQVPLSQSAGQLAGLAPNAQVFRIAEADIPRLEAMRETTRARRKVDPDDTKGTLTVTSGACRTATLPSGPLPVTTKLKTAPDEPYFTLTRNVDLRTLVPARQLQTEVPLCQS